MKYVNVTYKGGLHEYHYLTLTKNKTYKGIIKRYSLFIEDDESEWKNNSYADLKKNTTCYLISPEDRCYFDEKEI